MRMSSLRPNEDDYQSSEYERGYIDGVNSVLYLRCMRHREAPQLNANVTPEGECAICALADPLNGKLGCGGGSQHSKLYPHPKGFDFGLEAFRI